MTMMTMTAKARKERMSGMNHAALSVPARSPASHANDGAAASILTAPSSVLLSLVRAEFAGPAAMELGNDEGCFVLLAVLRGEGVVTVNGVSAAVTPRNAVILGRSEGSVDWRAGTRALVVRLPCADAHISASARHGGARRLTRGPLSLDMRQAHDLGRWLGLLAERDAEPEEGAVVLTTILAAVALQHGVEAAFPPSRSISFARAYLDTHVGEGVKLAALAGKAGVTPITLQRGFKAYLGMTVAGYSQSVRLHAARARLTCGWESRGIATIAQEAGFRSVTSFSREYQKLFEETPTQTRIQASRINNVIHIEPK